MEAHSGGMHVVRHSVGADLVERVGVRSPRHGHAPASLQLHESRQLAKAYGDDGVIPVQAGEPLAPRQPLRKGAHG